MNNQVQPVFKKRGIRFHLFLFIVLFFWPCCTVYGILVPLPGIEPGALAMRARSSNHWTAREFPRLHLSREEDQRIQKHDFKPSHSLCSKSLWSRNHSVSVNQGALLKYPQRNLHFTKQHKGGKFGPNAHMHLTLGYLHQIMTGPVRTIHALWEGAVCLWD